MTINQQLCPPMHLLAVPVTHIFGIATTDSIFFDDLSLFSLLQIPFISGRFSKYFGFFESFLFSLKKACKLTSSSCTHNSRDENQTCKIENLTSIDNTKCIKNTSKDYEISLMRKIHKEKCNSTPNDLHLLDNKVNALGNDDVLVDKLAKKDCHSILYVVLNPRTSRFRRFLST